MYHYLNYLHYVSVLLDSSLQKVHVDPNNFQGVSNSNLYLIGVLPWFDNTLLDPENKLTNAVNPLAISRWIILNSLMSAVAANFYA